MRSGSELLFNELLSAVSEEEGGLCLSEGFSRSNIYESSAHAEFEEFNDTIEKVDLTVLGRIFHHSIGLGHTVCQLFVIFLQTVKVLVELFNLGQHFLGCVVGLSRLVFNSLQLSSCVCEHTGA